MEHRIKKAFRLAFLGALLYSFWLMLRLSLPYTAIKPNIDFLETKQFVYHIVHWRYSFYVHVFTSILVLVCGLLQFSVYILSRQPVLHRLCGYIYIVTVLLVSGPAAFVLAIYANGGWPARISFLLLSVCWMGFTAKALLEARARRFALHGNWMLRSYALTLSAISLRTYALIFDLLHVNMRPADVYILISWASWIPNLIIAEWLIRRGFIAGITGRKTSFSES